MSTLYSIFASGVVTVPLLLLLRSKASDLILARESLKSLLPQRGKLCKYPTVVGCLSSILSSIRKSKIFARRPAGQMKSKDSFLSQVLLDIDGRRLKGMDLKWFCVFDYVLLLPTFPLSIRRN